MKTYIFIEYLKKIKKKAQCITSATSNGLRCTRSRTPLRVAEKRYGQVLKTKTVCGSQRADHPK